MNNNQDITLHAQIVIVESGATKSDWRVLDGDGKQVKQFLRSGMNVSTMQLSGIKDIISEAVGSEGLHGILGFYMYTAGVVTDAIRGELTDAVRDLCPDARIDIQNDLMGAARSACGHSPGIAAILGTGSNTCFYDGITLSQKVYSGGFVIGDDGSGASLGRLFLSDFIKGIVPEAVAADFSREFDSSYAAIVEGVYRSPSPSGYLGSLAPFIIARYGDPYIKELVDNNFRRFIDRSLLRYDVKDYPVGIVGGFGWACRDILRPLLDRAGIRVSRFIKAPIDGLCEYHKPVC
ncbi:MAG: hypothetical protein IJM35_03430 [Bacteroidales bacterium]|nr:hypothetical protein [Bacteroidales bacterium]